MKRAVIFDLDGTLWDAVGPLTDYWNEVRQQELSGCRRITAAQMQSWMGQGVRELARSILRRSGRWTHGLTPTCNTCTAKMTICCITRPRSIPSCTRRLTCCVPRGSRS